MGRGLRRTQAAGGRDWEGDAFGRTTERKCIAEPASPGTQGSAEPRPPKMRPRVSVLPAPTFHPRSALAPRSEPPATVGPWRTHQDRIGAFATTCGNHRRGTVGPAALDPPYETGPVESFSFSAQGVLGSERSDHRNPTNQNRSGPANAQRPGEHPVAVVRGSAGPQSPPTPAAVTRSASPPSPGTDPPSPRTSRGSTSAG